VSDCCLTPTQQSLNSPRMYSRTVLELGDSICASYILTVVHEKVSRLMQPVILPGSVHSVTDIVFLIVLLSPLGMNEEIFQKLGKIYTKFYDINRGLSSHMEGFRRISQAPSTQQSNHKTFACYTLYFERSILWEWLCYNWRLFMRVFIVYWCFPFVCFSVEPTASYFNMYCLHFCLK
jgi:hypothetical protein